MHSMGEALLFLLLLSSPFFAGCLWADRKVTTRWFVGFVLLDVATALSYVTLFRDVLVF